MLVDINLLPEKDRERSTLLFAAIAIIAAAILVWVILFFVAQNYTKQAAKLETQKMTLLDQQAAIQSTLQVSEFAADKQALFSTINWAENYQFDTIPLLAGLVRLLPERGFFDEFEFVGPNSAVLMIQFNTTNEAAYYLTRLQTAEFIDSVTLESISAEDLEVTDDEEEMENNLDLHKLPRYLAVYHVNFFDERVVIDTPLDDENVIVEPPAEEDSSTEDEGGDQDE